VIAALAAGLAAGYGVAIPMGAVGALLISLSARMSFRVGAAAAIGVATADLLYATIAALGGAALAHVVAPVATPLRWIASAVLVVMAVRTGVTALRRHRDRATAAPDGMVLTTPVRAYLGLLGITVLNPTTIIFFTAFVLGREAGPGQGLNGPDAVVFAVTVFLASASWQLLLAGGGTLVGRLLTGPRGRLATALVSSAVITALAVKVLLSG
jgi:threonine/homoserine/homoserine lactone efflux protein